MSPIATRAAAQLPKVREAHFARVTRALPNYGGSSRGLFGGRTKGRRTLPYGRGVTGVHWLEASCAPRQDDAMRNEHKYFMIQGRLGHGFSPLRTRSGGCFEDMLVAFAGTSELQNVRTSGLQNFRTSDVGNFRQCTSEQELLGERLGGDMVKRTIDG
eukprot:scaffold3403_cov300-Pinguiococcus_pyrenoidosus.AAC.3